MSTFMRRLLGRDRDGELREEIRSHLEMAVRDRVARGEPRAQAEAAARRELGNATTIAEVTRETWGTMWLERLAQDLRYALRLLRRNPGFAAVAILSLALGIGANAAIFQVIDAIRLRTLPLANPGELAEVRLADPRGMRGSFTTWNPTLTNPIWEQIEARQEGFTGIFAWSARELNLADGGESRPAQGLFVSGGYFAVLGVRPAIGRLLAAADDARGCAPRAVISYPFWQRQFGGAPAALGQMLAINGQTAEIVGVSQPGFFGLEVGRAFDVAVPICAEPLLNPPGHLESGTTWWLTVMGRRGPGWPLARATAQLGAISPSLFKTTLPPAYPAVSVPRYLGFTLAAYDAGSGISRLRESYGSPLWLLLGTAALVLLIACANLANLLLARATARQREIAVRLGLGASRRRVIRQLLTESLLLAAAGAAGGVLIASGLSRSLVSFIRTADPTLVLDLGTDWRVLAFTAALAALTCMLFGLAPALKATGVGADAVLKPHGRGVTAGRDRVGLRRGLVVVQVALSLVLLTGALLFARSLRNLLDVNPGFRSDGVLVAAIDLRRAGLTGDRALHAQRDILDRLRELPGVQAAALTAIVPLSGDGWGNDIWVERGGARTHANGAFNRISSGYFAALGIPFVSGRDFDDAVDTPSAPEAAIVNEAFAGALTGGADPVGTRFTVESTPSSPERSLQIVGLVKDAKYLTLREEIQPGVFVADSQEQEAPSYARIVLRSSLPPESLAPSVTRRLTEFNPRAVVRYAVLTTQIADTLVPERLMATLSGFFGGLAALLTLIGLYGVIAYTVARRTNEIGVRMALGATRGDVLSMILREAGVLVAAGIAVGVLLTLAGGEVARTQLFELAPNDPLTLGLAAAGLAAVALVASYAPARSASRIEPNAALRVE